MSCEPKSANKPIETLTQQLIRAKIHYDIWWFYVGVETRPLVVSTFEDYSEFQRFDEHAHFVSLIVHIGTIWDKRSDTINLPKLWKKAFVSSGNEALQNEFDACLALAQKVREIRHNAIAHRSAKLDYKSAFELAAISPNEILNLIIGSMKLINMIRCSHDMGEQEFNPLPIRDFTDLVEAIGN